MVRSRPFFRWITPPPSEGADGRRACPGFAARHFPRDPLREDAFSAGAFSEGVFFERVLHPFSARAMVNAHAADPCFA